MMNIERFGRWFAGTQLGEICLKSRETAALSVVALRGLQLCDIILQIITHAVRMTNEVFDGLNENEWRDATVTRMHELNGRCAHTIVALLMVLRHPLSARVVTGEEIRDDVEDLRRQVHSYCESVKSLREKVEGADARVRLVERTIEAMEHAASADESPLRQAVLQDALQRLKTGMKAVQALVGAKKLLTLHNLLDDIEQEVGAAQRDVSEAPTVLKNIERLKADILKVQESGILKEAEDCERTVILTYGEATFQSSFYTRILDALDAAPRRHISAQCALERGCVSEAKGHLKQGREELDSAISLYSEVMRLKGSLDARAEDLGISDLARTIPKNIGDTTVEMLLRVGALDASVRENCSLQDHPVLMAAQYNLAKTALRSANQMLGEGRSSELIRNMVASGYVAIAEGASLKSEFELRFALLIAPPPSESPANDAAS